MLHKQMTGSPAKAGIKLTCSFWSYAVKYNAWYNKYSLNKVIHLSFKKKMYSGDTVTKIEN